MKSIKWWARVLKQRNKGYKYFFRTRNGEIKNVPDAIAYPESAEKNEAILNFAKENKIKAYQSVEIFKTMAEK